MFSSFVNSCNDAKPRIFGDVLGKKSWGLMLATLVMGAVIMSTVMIGAVSPVFAGRTSRKPKGQEEMDFPRQQPTRRPPKNKGKAKRVKMIPLRSLGNAPVACAAQNMDASTADNTLLGAQQQEAALQDVNMAAAEQEAETPAGMISAVLIKEEGIRAEAAPVDALQAPAQPMLAGGNAYKAREANDEMETMKKILRERKAIPPPGQPTRSNPQPYVSSLARVMQFWAQTKRTLTIPYTAWLENPLRMRADDHSALIPHVESTLVKLCELHTKHKLVFTHAGDPTFVRHPKGDAVQIHAFCSLLSFYMQQWGTSNLSVCCAVNAARMHAEADKPLEQRDPLMHNNQIRLETPAHGQQAYDQVRATLWPKKPLVRLQGLIWMTRPLATA